MPKSRQSLLFSATISASVKDFTLSGIKDYKMVQVDKDSKLSDDLVNQFYIVKSLEKVACLLFIMQELIGCKEKREQTIIFAATRHHVEYLYETTQAAGLKSVYIYGAMDQSTREDRLMKFRQKKVSFLIVTDLAARGIDIPLLDNVIHYDFPTSLKLYIHRSGRTARAGQKGTSYSIITNEEMGYLHDLSVYVGKKYADSLGSLQAQTKEGELDTLITTESIATDPNYISFGILPQNVLDEYTVYADNVF